MDIEILNRSLFEAKTPLLVLPVLENQEYGELNEVNHKLSNAVKEAIKDKEFEGKLNQLYSLNTLNNLSHKKVLLVGLGKEEELTLEKIRQAYGSCSKYANSLRIKHYSTILLKSKKFKPEEITLALVEGARLGSYQFTKFKTKDKDSLTKINLLSIITSNKEILHSIKKAIILTDSVFLVRDLVNNPASFKTPTYISEVAKKVAKESGLKCTVLQKPQIEKLKMGALLGVAKGSTQPPAFVILEYRPNKKGKTIAFVGKGITFDSGGINLKPWDGMKDMRDDMAGAATVLGLMRTAALLRLNINLVGLMPLTENMPGGSAMKPGDILTTYSGKNIEMLHSDAEGRLILADALSFAEKNFKPDKIIDLATLTGACVVALGTVAAGLMSKNKELVKELLKASEESGERIWELPLYDEFKKEVESSVADVKNIGNPRGYAGALTAGAFLSEFVEKTPWAHFDIAGPAFVDDAQHYLSSGGTGFGVRLLTQFLLNESK